MMTETTETRNRKRVNLTLAPATVAKLGDVLNASRYIDALVKARDREWRSALRTLRAGGFSLAEINTHVNAGEIPESATSPNARRFALLAAELEAGNHAVHAALQEDEDEAAAAARSAEQDRRAAQDRRAEFLMGPGYERAARLRREQQSEERARSINKGRAIAKVLR